MDSNSATGEPTGVIGNMSGGKTEERKSVKQVSATLNSVKPSSPVARHSPYRHLGPTRETAVNSDIVARSKMGMGLSDVLLMTTFCLVACKILIRLFIVPVQVYK